MFQNRRKATCILFGRVDTSRQNNGFFICRLADDTLIIDLVFYFDVIIG